MGKKTTVIPITDRNLVKDISEYLYNWNEMYGFMFSFGIYTGFRISDILPLKIRDLVKFLEENCVTITEKKTGNRREVALNSALKKAIKEYIKGKESYEYVFKSNKKTKGVNMPISREHAGRIIKKAADKFGLKHICTHSMRKTFALFIYELSGKDMNAAREALGHEDISYTKLYLGLGRLEVNDLISELEF